MARYTFVVAVVILALGAGACGSPRPINYYGLQAPPAPTPSPATYPIDLSVSRLTGSSLLEAAPIVYRTSANKIGTYTYQRWEDAPVGLVQSKVIRMLLATGLYQSVSPSGEAPPGEYGVRGRLYQFEEVDSEGIAGRVAFEFELYNRRSGKVLWSHYYAETVPAGDKEVSGVVQAIDRNLDKGLQEVVAGLGQYFARNPPKNAVSGVADRSK
jgi:ABC-type uncharacterized transport system auxiliary subunit